MKTKTMELKQAVQLITGMIGDPKTEKTVVFDQLQRQALFACMLRAEKDGNMEEGHNFFWSVGPRALKRWVLVSFLGNGEVSFSPSEDQTEVKQAKVQAILLRRKEALDGLLHIDPWRNVAIWDYPAKEAKA